MKKSLFTAFAVGLCMTASVMAQVPNYVPTNGLVGYWPFNGNANDESGNGNNGTVNGATLTTDRFGNANKAYNFDGVNSNIEVPSNQQLNLNSSFTISFWLNKSANSNYMGIISKNRLPNGGSYAFEYNDIIQGIGFGVNNDLGGCSNCQQVTYANNLNQLNNWEYIIGSWDNTSLKLYSNGILLNSTSGVLGNGGTLISSNFSLFFGKYLSSYLHGKLDDIGIWNRALTQQEITALYNSCSENNIISQPSNSLVNVGSSAQFSTNAASGSTYQWQSNPLNTGWLNLTNNSTYSGVSSNTLNVTNTTISNHNQPFRAIVNAGGCIDTSDVVQIIIGDTCLTTVTDTLIINTTLGLPAPNNENTILIYPNPASDHITIDNGNYTAMAGYTIKIENNAGQQVFQSAINQQQFYVDLSTWSGNGLYFVHLIDAQNNTVTVRKIVLQ